MASSLPSGPTLGTSSSRMEAPDTYISSVERHTQGLWVYEGDQMVHRSVGRFASLALGRTPKVDTVEQEGTGARDDEGDGEFARGDHVKAWPSPEQFLKHPLAIFALVPKDAALFLAGAVGGAATKTLTAPVDRIKLLMQTHSARIIGKSARAGISFFEATAFIVKEEGVKGFWKGSFPQMRGEKQLVEKMLQTEINLLRSLRYGTTLMQHMEDFYYITLLELLQKVLHWFPQWN